MRISFYLMTLCLLSASPAFGYKIRQAAIDGGRLKKLPARFLIARNSNTASILDRSEIIAARNAFEAWSHVSGTELQIKFDSNLFFEGTCEEALSQNINVICFIDTRVAIQALAGLAAVPPAANPVVGGARNVANGNFLGAFVILNEEDFQFRTDTFDQDDQSKYDLQAAITQGLAEVVGLTESASEDSITRIFKAEDSKKFRTLHEDDIRGTQFLYPAVDGLPGVSCDTTQKQGEIPLTSGLLLLFGLLFLTRRSRMKKSLPPDNIPLQ